MTPGACAIFVHSNVLYNNIQFVTRGHKKHWGPKQYVPFFMQNFCLTVFTFGATFTPLSLCVLRDVKFSLNHNFKQLNSIGGSLILKVK